MALYYAIALVFGLILVIGGLQALGETRLTWVFPVISVVAVVVFLARCMFVAPAAHH